MAPQERAKKEGQKPPSDQALAKVEEIQSNLGRFPHGSFFSLTEFGKKVIYVYNQGLASILRIGVAPEGETIQQPDLIRELNPIQPGSDIASLTQVTIRKNIWNEPEVEIMIGGDPQLSPLGQNPELPKEEGFCQVSYSFPPESGNLKPLLELKKGKGSPLVSLQIDHEEVKGDWLDLLWQGLDLFLEVSAP